MNNLIEPYKKQLCLDDAEFSLIEHNDAIVAIVYKITERNGKEYILKICPRESDYACEYYFLNYFKDKILVPHIIEVLAPENNVYGAVLMECLPGNLLQPDNLTLQLAFDSGTLLAQIHSHKAAGFGDLTQPQQLSYDPAAYFTFKFDEGMDECNDHLPNLLLKLCREFYNNHIQLLKLADGPCIIHRDFRPGNILIRGDKIQGIIDWSSARGGFAEEDFAPLVMGNWTDDVNLKRSFLAGYESMRKVPDYQNVMLLLKLSKAIATIGYTVKTKTWNGKNASLYQRHRQFLDEFFSKHL